MEARHLGVGEERVRPPDAAEHLVADAQLFFAGRAEVESRVVPELAEVEVKSKVLHKRHTVSWSRCFYLMKRQAKQIDFSRLSCRVRS